MTTSARTKPRQSAAPAGDDRRLLLSCPTCGNSRTVAPLGDAAVGTLATLQCSTCGGRWTEIITPYSRSSEDG